MFGKSEPRLMGKRAILELGGETLRRVPVYEYPDGEREVLVPLDRLTHYTESGELPEFAEVTHSGYDYEAELILDEEEPVYLFHVDHY
jgi:hypothetical protein